MAKPGPKPGLRDAAKAAQEEQRRREAARSVVATQAGTVAQGQRMVRVLGPGNLNPNVRDELTEMRFRETVYCGRIAGIAMTVRRHKNAKDEKRESLCFAGSFMFIGKNGAVQRTLEAYLPSQVERAFAGMLESGSASQVQFALEVWAEPDAISGRRTAGGYQYVSFDLAPAQARDPLLEFAASAGVIEAPTLAIEGDAEAAPGGAGYDPDTGEVREAGQSAA